MNKKLFQKIVLIALALVILIALVAPAIFGQTGQPRQEKLLNGLKVLMWQDPASDKVSVRLRIHSGSAFDPQGKEGTMQMLADNLVPNEAAREFFTDDLGGSLEITSNYDYIEMRASSKASQYLSMLETIASAISNPPIDKETTAKLRTSQLAKIALEEGSTNNVAHSGIKKRLFGTFPYGRPRIGTVGSVAKIEFADLIDAKSRFLTADNATLALSGNFPRAEAFRAVRRYFGAWLKSDRKIPFTFRQPDEPDPAVLVLPSPEVGGSAARFAIRGLAESDPDMAAAMIFVNVLRTRMRGHTKQDDLRVFMDVAVLRGMLVVEFMPIKNPDGSFSITTEQQNSFKRSLSEPITQSEFATAKATATDDWSKRDLISFWLDADTYKITNLDMHRRVIDKVTLLEVNAYAEKARNQPVASVIVHTPPKAH